MAKRLFLFFLLTMCLMFTSNAYAADSTGKLPTRLTYAKEWLNSHVFTWRSDSRVKLFDRYASDRVDNIILLKDNDSSDRITEFSNRYQSLKSRENEIIGKKKLKAETLDLVQQTTLDQQKLLSEVRQELKDRDDQKIIAGVQEQVVNETKKMLLKTGNAEASNQFNDRIISVWRDPNNESKDEEGTRVYAAGTTTDNGNLNNGIIIDGGQGRIVEQSGELKIEYAPGTGPDSITTTEGKKIWKILQSDGTTIESYSPASNVVIGSNGSASGNIVVNTMAGQAGAGTANVVAGSGGAATVEVVGGLPTVKTGQVGQESGGPVADPSQTIIKPTNSINSANQMNSVNGSAGGGQVEQAAPQQMVP